MTFLRLLLDLWAGSAHDRNGAITAYGARDRRVRSAPLTAGRRGADTGYQPIVAPGPPFALGATPPFSVSRTEPIAAHNPIMETR
jgi:hypothetical protein